MSQAETRPWMDAARSPDERADLLISAMTLDELISLVHGPMPNLLDEVPADAARGAGIQVRCREPSEIPPRLQRATSDMLVCYAMRCGKQGSKSSSVTASSGSNSLWVRTIAGWEGRDSEALPAWLTTLDPAIEVIIRQPEEVQVYWTERGQDSTLEQVFETLNRLKS